MSKLKSTILTTVQYFKDRKNQSDQDIRCFNWVNSNKDFWFKKFMQSRNISLDGKKVAFFSVFGDPFVINFDKSDLKIFFSGENLHRNEFGFSFQDYSDYAQDEKFDLSLGFDYLEAESYLRFPLWILYFVNPEETTPLNIKRLCEKFSFHSTKDIKSKKFCSLVSGHDPSGLRKEIYDSLLSIDKISCGGRFLNNTDELKRVYNDNKIKYLEQYKFNICPENSNARGYVTEKIMEAIFAGAIPVYWGSDNNPEPEILNKNAIILWNKNGDNTGNINLISSLAQAPGLYEEFYSQPRFIKEAPEYICEMLWGLEDKLRKLISAKK